jgi:hypothetical protein
MTQAFDKHDEVLAAIERVQRFLEEGFLSGEETCNPDDWTMGCAGCQARMISLQLDMLRREIEDDSVRPPAHGERRQ